MDRRGRRSLRFLEKFEHLRAIFLFYKHTDKSKFDMQNLTIGCHITESRPDPDASHRPTGSTPPRPCHSE